MDKHFIIQIVTVVLAVASICAIAVPGVFASSTVSRTAVEGQVSDQKGEPVPFMNVVLLNPGDSALVQGAITDELGQFKINAYRDKGILRISGVGYETMFVDVVDEYMKLTINEDVHTLGEVTVTAQRPKTKLTGNSLVTRIDGTVLGQSGNAKEMLAKVPGITQNGDDLEVIGRGKPVYYINGRKLLDLDELKRLRSEEIKDVEVITNPGAAYDATVSAVVRISTLRRQGEGFGFDVNLNSNNDLRYGYYDPSATLNMRYRHNAFDVFGMVNYWNWSTVSNSTPHQWSYVKKNGVLSVIEQQSDMRHDWTGWGMNYNLGFNWQPADNHSVGMRIERHDRYDAGYQAWIDNRVLEYPYGAEADATERDSHSTQNNIEKMPYSWNGNAYYAGRVGQLGIDLNVDFLTDKSTDIVDIEEESDGFHTMESNSETSNSMIADKLVLSYPIWKGLLQVGTEMSFVRRKSNYNITGSTLPNTASEVKEDNIAAFADYAFMIPKVGSISAGLRYEHVGFDYEDLVNPEASMTRYTDDLFPSVSWANQWGSVQTALSYSYKTERPSYWTLNESMIYINEYSLQTGDPTLKNVKIQSLSANARWKWCTLFINYERRDDALSQWSYIYNDEGVILIKNINLPSPVRDFTVGLNASPTWGVYSANWTAGLQKFNYKQTLADPREADGSREVRYDNPIGFFYCNNAIRLSHSWQLEANLSIVTRGDCMNFRLLEPRYTLGFVVQKCWLKDDALCLRASIYDVLQRSDEKVEMDCGYYTLIQNSLRDSHRLDVSLRYVFNAASNKYKGSGAGKDAAGRMKK